MTSPQSNSEEEASKPDFGADAAHRRHASSTRSSAQTGYRQRRRSSEARTVFRFLSAMVVWVLGIAQGNAEQGSEEFTVGMVVWRGCEEACQGFRDYIADRGLPLQIVQYDAAQDAAALDLILHALREDTPDLLVTWGTTVSLSILGRHDEPMRPIDELGVPAVFMIVSQPIESGLVPDYSSSGRQITGVRYLLSEETQLNVARSYLSFERIGVVFNPLERNSTLSVERLGQISADMGFELTAFPVALQADGTPDASSIPGLVDRLAGVGVQAIYQGPDSFMNAHSDALSESALDYGIPVFAAGENPVRYSSALLGVTNSYYVVGQMAAQQAELILFEGRDPASLAITLPPRYAVVINMSSAHSLQLFPPMQLLGVAELIAGQ